MTNEQLEQWAKEVRFENTDDLAKKIFREIMMKNPNINPKFGPTEDRSQFYITINDFTVHIPLETGK